MPKVGQKEIRRKQIIKSVLKIIASQGIDHLTLEVVAKNAGISKGIVSYYFSSKEDLIVQSYKEILEAYMNSMMEEITVPKAMDILKIIIDKMFSNVKYDGLLFTNEEMERILIQFYMKSSFDKEFGKFTLRVYNEYYEQIKMVIDYGIFHKDFQNVSPDKVSYIIMSLMDGLMIYNIIKFNPTNKDPKELLYKYFSDILLKE